MRTLAVLTALLALACVLPGPAAACSDLLELFVARGTYDAEFSARVLEMSHQIRTLEVDLHDRRADRVATGTAALLDRWFSFYQKYAPAPPADWVGQPEWLPRLSAVTKAMAALKAEADTGSLDRLHDAIRTMNDTLVALFRGSKPGSEATLLDLAATTVDRLRKGLLAGSAAVELSRPVGDLRTLATPFRDAFPAGLAEADRPAYAEARDAFVAAATALPEDGAFAGTVEARLTACEAALAAFRARRTALLKASWFR